MHESLQHQWSQDGSGWFYSDADVSGSAISTKVEENIILLNNKVDYYYYGLTEPYIAERPTEYEIEIKEEDVKQAFKHQEEFNVNIELIHDDEPNCYIYKDDDLIYCHGIFGKWYNKLIKLKNKYPSNKLIKKLMTELWGNLSAYNKIYINKEEMKNYNSSLDTSTEYQVLDHKINNNNFETFELLNNEDPAKINIRLKAFLPRINLRFSDPPKWSFAKELLTHYYVLKPEDYAEITQ